MAYEFKDLGADTYQVADHTIYKDGNGKWISKPPIEDARLEKAVLNYTKNL